MIKKLNLALLTTIILSIVVACSPSANNTSEDINNVTENDTEASQSNESESKESSEETPDEDVDTLKVAMLTKEIKVAPIVIAHELGFFEEEGVNVELEEINNLSDGITALSINKMDILPFGIIPSASFIAQGSEVYIFGGTLKEGTEGISMDDTKITDISQLEGKKIGCFRMETGQMVLKNHLLENGIDAEFIYLDSYQSIVEGVKKGEVDFGLINRGYGYVAEQSGANVVFKVADFEPDYPCCRQTASPEAYNNKKDALVKYMTAVLRGYEVFLNDNDTSVVTLMNYSGQDEEYVKSLLYGWKEYETAMRVSMDPNKKKVIEFYEIMKANGEIDQDNPNKIEDYIDIDIYESALNILIDRGENVDLYEMLLEESKVNNY